MRYTPRWLALALAVAAVFALLAFTACGGDDDDNGGTSTSGATATHGAGASNTAGANQTTQATEPAGTDDILDELKNLGGDIQQITGKVTYESTDSDGTTSTLTFYSKPPKSRFDTVDADGAKSSIIETQDGTYYCDDSSQGCTFTSTGGTSVGGLGFLSAIFSPQYIDALVSAAESQGVDIHKSSENIAGTDATCFSGTYQGDTGKFCFSDSGVMLLSQSQSADNSDNFSLKATEFSTDVSDSDFEPPYPVTTIPTG